jgi:cyclase
MAKIGIIGKARILRKENTEAEKILWKSLRGNKLGVRWRRQHPIDMYILDFYSPTTKLCIELDGSVHKIKENKEYDSAREKYLKIKGIRTIRFWNSDIEKNIGTVLDKIDREMDSSPL